jgi:hypothetical protein
MMGCREGAAAAVARHSGDEVLDKLPQYASYWVLSNKFVPQVLSNLLGRHTQSFLQHHCISSQQPLEVVARQTACSD